MSNDKTLISSNVSIAVDEELVLQIENALKQGLFRNKSHIMEYVVKKLLKESHA